MTEMRAETHMKNWELIQWSCMTKKKRRSWVETEKYKEEMNEKKWKKKEHKTCTKKIVVLI